MSIVLINSCPDYSRENIERAVAQVFEGLRWADRIEAGQKALLKVNLLSPVSPESAVTTHPELVRAVAKWLLERKVKVMVGDSSGGFIPGSSRTARAFKVCGMIDALQELDVEIVNFDSAGVSEVDNPRGQGAQKMFISKVLHDCDLVISMPKLKTHTLTVFTGAVKNMFGCVPGGKKSWYHKIAPDISSFSEYLVDIFAVTKPHLAIMDAIVGMEGHGPSAGNPKQIGAILASEDAVALDATACRLVNIRPESVEMLTKAAARRLGEMRRGTIEIIGPFDELKVKRFRSRSRPLPIPGFLIRRFLDLAQAYPVINHNTCVSCRICFHSCPVQAIKVQEDKGLLIDRAECIQCFCCHELCPEQAVDFTDTPLLKLINRFRRSE